MTDLLREAELLSKGASVAGRLAALSLLRDLPASEARQEIIAVLALDEISEVSQAAKSLEPNAGEETRSRDLPALEVSTSDLTIAQISAGLLRIVDAKGSSPDREFPIPQANSLDTLYRFIVAQQYPEILAVEKVFSGLSPRQIDYYANAAGFLELDKFFPSEARAIQLYNSISGGDFLNFVAHLVERHSLLRRRLQSWVLDLPPDERLTTPSALSVWAEELGYLPLSPETLRRRTQTVDAWFTWITEKLDLMTVTSERDEPWVPPINLTSAISRLTELEMSGLLASSPSTRKKEPRKSKGSRITTRNDFDSLLPRVGSFLESERPTLDDVGGRIGVTRERARQIERLISDKSSQTLELEGSEAFGAIRSRGGKRDPVDLCDWALRCLKLAYEEEHMGLGQSPLSNPLESFDKDWQVIGTLDSEFGEEVQTSIPFGKTGGLRKTVFLLRLVLIHEGYSSPSAAGGLWLHESTPGTIPAPQQQTPAQLHRERKLQRLRKALESGPKDARSLALEVGDGSMKALAEFMRQNQEFTLWRGKWYLSTDPLLNDTGPRFSSAYDAVIYALEHGGPMLTKDLHAKLETLHPMSLSRMQQTLDHRRIGKLSDGRVALEEHGGKRPTDSQPTVPAGLRFNPPEVSWAFQINTDHLRGSGFGLPRWIGWKLGLTATPDSATFSNNGFNEFTVTRRGGAILAGSIRGLLLEMRMEANCLGELTLNVEQKSFEFQHLCENHPSVPEVSESKRSMSGLSADTSRSPTLRQLAEKTLGVRLPTLLPRFESSGWRYQGRTDLDCSDCGQEEYEIFRKPYTTTKGNYEYWGIVCTHCLSCSGLDEFDQPSGNLFRAWANAASSGRAPAKKPASRGKTSDSATGNRNTSVPTESSPKTPKPGEVPKEILPLPGDPGRTRRPGKKRERYRTGEEASLRHIAKQHRWW